MERVPSSNMLFLRMREGRVAPPEIFSPSKKMLALRKWNVRPVAWLFCRGTQSETGGSPGPPRLDIPPRPINPRRTPPLSRNYWSSNFELFEESGSSREILSSHRERRIDPPPLDFPQKNECFRRQEPRKAFLGDFWVLHHEIVIRTIT